MGSYLNSLQNSCILHKGPWLNSSEHHGANLVVILVHCSMNYCQPWGSVTASLSGAIFSSWVCSLVLSLRRLFSPGTPECSVAQNDHLPVHLLSFLGDLWPTLCFVISLQAVGSEPLHWILGGSRSSVRVMLSLWLAYLLQPIATTLPPIPQILGGPLGPQCLSPAFLRLQSEESVPRHSLWSSLRGARAGREAGLQGPRELPWASIWLFPGQFNWHISLHWGELGLFWRKQREKKSCCSFFVFHVLQIEFVKSKRKP